MESLAQPNPPTNPEPVQPPTLTAPIAPGLESPKALLKRSKEVAKTVKLFIRQNRSMQLTIEGKKYPRAEVWQFAAACFGVTPMVTRTEEVISEKGEELGFVSIAHAVNSAGRIVSGAEAACMYSEPDWQGKPSFQLRAMAQTRSTSRVLRHIFAYVMVMAGLCPTPAEEMDKAQETKRELTTPCYECGNKVTKKRSLETRRKFGKELCIPCEKKLKAEQGEKMLAPINDPKFVAQSVAQIRERKANGGAPQAIVAVMDAGREEIA